MTGRGAHPYLPPPEGLPQWPHGAVRRMYRVRATRATRSNKMVQALDSFVFISEFSYLTHLECGRCGDTYDATRLMGTCVSCGAPLLARYDLAALAKVASPDSFADRPPTLWRYHELLPA